jgi:parvulin-like peptidyl-prolyl isomerase
MALLAAVVAVALAILIWTGLSYFAKRDWAAIASVNGEPISRAALHDRIAAIDLLQALAAERTALVPNSQVDAIRGRFNGDPVEIARQQLIVEVLLRRFVLARGLNVPPSDLNQELARAVNQPVDRQVRWVRLSAGAHSAPEVAVAVTRLGNRLSAGDSVADLRSLLGATWTIAASESWIDHDGPEGLPSGLPPSVGMAARTASSEASLPMFDDGLGHIVMARVVAIHPGIEIGDAMHETARQKGVSDDGLRSWAEGQVLRRVVADALVAEWRKRGGDQFRLAELNLGEATGGPPMVELEHLVVRRLESADPAARGRSIVAELASLSAADRRTRFESLVAEANAGGVSDRLEMSGEIGWLASNGLIPDLATAAFSPGRVAGDVVGPLDTSAGPELFLVRARSEHSLADRAAAIAIEAAVPGADLARIARRVSVDDASRASGGRWRALAELPAKVRQTAGIDISKVGDLVGPIDLEGEMVLGRVLERRAGPFAEEELAALQFEGFATWVEDQLDGATITIDPDPLGLGSASPATPSSVPHTQVPFSSAPRASLAGQQPFGISTPPIQMFPSLP